MKRISQVKAGILISYVFIIINALYTIVITPYIIKCIGLGEFGVYKTIGSLTSSLMVLDLGIGGTVQRYVAKYIANREHSSIPNFLAMNIIQATFLSLVIAVVCFFLFFLIEPTYSSSFSTYQLSTAKIVFIILAVSMLTQPYADVLNGVIVGYNHFIFGNGVKLVKIIIRIIAIFCFLVLFKSAITIAIIDLFLSLLMIVAQIIYIRTVLKINVILIKWDNSVFLEAGKYTILMFITTLATQINSNVDNIIIGAIKGPDYVTIYSIGLLIFGMFQNISGAVSGTMLPTITNALIGKDSKNNVISLVIRAGRFQFLLLGAGVIGFITIGKDFIHIWLGDGFDDVYIISLILVIPALFELCINVCLSILRAQNRLVFRTVIVSISTVLNVLITLIAVTHWSYIGAAIGTAISYILCSLIAMNIYYKKVIGLPIGHIYKEIVRGIWLCLICSFIGVSISSHFINGSLGYMLLNIIVFCSIYSATLLLFGLSREEKKNIPFISSFIK